MRINRIVVNNIGSYEGENIFNISVQSDIGKIVLIGGKNGAGKTTLFNAIKLCLYGYKEGGYQSINSFYKKKVKKLINNDAKRINGSVAYIEIEFSVISGTDSIDYRVNRGWNLEGNDISEALAVYKNEVLLNEDEVNDFDNYILNIIPPELFELYFFDGEKITGYFLEDGGNTRLKNAFMLLCGYDTFDIMYKNFKRINVINKTDDAIVNRYTLAKEKYEAADLLVKKIANDVNEKKNELSETRSTLTGLERNYRKKGGVTLKEWNDKFLKQKEEERFRESKNEWIKKAANDSLPFLIIKDRIEALKEQIEDEEVCQNTKATKETCETTLQTVLAMAKGKNKINDEACDYIMKEAIKLLSENKMDKEVLLGLSMEEKQQLSLLISHLLALNPEDILLNRKEVKESIERVALLKEEIGNSSVDKFQDYIEEKENLLKKIEDLSKELESLIAYQNEMEIDRSVLLDRYKREEKILEEELKKSSVTDLSSKAILFLEELQNTLFYSELRKVEKYFIEKIDQMARKSNFIDEIMIDDNFGIHIFRNTSVCTKEIIEKIKSVGKEDYIKEYGEYHWNNLIRAFETDDTFTILEELNKQKTVDVVYEIDKTLLSKGEQQIFIMTLYWSIMKLCKQTVPFFIDTPFARIDTEHRENITEKFFKELNGQVFIFSTNEEIVGKHVELLGSSIQARFMLENIDNKRTNLIANKYFGEE